MILAIKFMRDVGSKGRISIHIQFNFVAYELSTLKCNLAIIAHALDLYFAFCGERKVFVQKINK